MDARLIEVIETESAAFGDDALVWLPVTPDAVEEWGEDYFIAADGFEMYPGCMYIGTVGDAKASIAAMNKEMSHAA